MKRHIHLQSMILGFVLSFVLTQIDAQTPGIID